MLDNKHCNRQRSISRGFRIRSRQCCALSSVKRGFLSFPPEVRHQKEQTAKEPLLTNPECRHLNAANRQSPLRRSNQSIAGQQRSKQTRNQSENEKPEKMSPGPKIYYSSPMPHTANPPLTNRPPILHRPSSRAPILPFFGFSLADFPLLLHLQIV